MSREARAGPPPYACSQASQSSAASAAAPAEPGYAAAAEGHASLVGDALAAAALHAAVAAAAVLVPFCSSFPRV